jgi:hypothetical protein
MRVAVIVLPSAASPRFDASFAMECQNIVGLGSKAARGQWQLNDMRIIPLVLSRGDFAFAPGHFSIGVVSFVFHIDVRLEACRQPWGDCRDQARCKLDRAYQRSRSRRQQGRPTAWRTPPSAELSGRGLLRSYLFQRRGHASQIVAHKPHRELFCEPL